MSEVTDTLREIHDLVAESEYKKGYAKGRADAINEVINNCSKEYQVFSDDTVCKIWLSDLNKLKEQKNG